MDPKLKQSIDNINSLNVSPEEKTALFGKLMEGVKAQYPPAPPMNTQQGFNVADINAARQGGGPLSQNMPFYSIPNVKKVIENSNSVDPYNRGGTNPSRNLPYDQSTNDRFLRGKEDYQKQQQMLSQTPLESVRAPVANPADDPFRGQLRQEGVGPIDEYSGTSLLNQTGGAEDDTNSGAFDPPQAPPSMFDDFKEYMFAGKDQQGLFGGTGIDPNDPKKTDRGSMGLSGAFGRLFDNPNRMAMLSGGLTALDPNSYYDKEGFSSPWTGLRSGLGGAQAGYKSVIDRRKAEADTALAKAKTSAEGQSSQKFKSAQIGDATFMYSDADIQRRRNELMVGGKMGWREATDQAIKETGTRIEKGISPKSTYEIKQAYTKGEGQLAQIDILEGYAQDALNSGFVGMGKRGWDSIQGALSLNTDTTESTKLINGINKLISQNWQSLVGGGQLSEPDQIFIDKVIKSPKSVFTTASEIRKSLSDLKRILRESQGRRAETIGIKDYDPSVGASPILGGGGSADDLINEFK